MNTHVSGRLGEVRAEQILVEKGYEILDRNVVYPGTELDLIARDGRVLVFIEVKTRSATAISGRMAVTPAKQRRICMGALRYMVQHHMMQGYQARFDVIEIQGTQVTHIVNAFPYQGPSV